MRGLLLPRFYLLSSHPGTDSRKAQLPGDNQILNEMDAVLKTKLSNIKHVALDMDGTIYLSNTLFPFTVPFLEGLGSIGVSHSFLTNNPTKSLDAYLDKLHGMGIDAVPEQMYTTTIAMIDYIRSHYPDAKRLFLLGTESMQSQFEAAGFEQSTDNPDDVPDIVVASFDMTLVYPRLCRAAWWVSQGIPYLATNPDRVCPTDQRTILVDCGSICKCIEYATGRKPDVTLGKPDPNMLLNILEQKGLEPAEIAMVGDRIYTDIAMARNAGAFGVLVLSGETSLEMAISASEHPDLIVENIAEFGRLLAESRK